MAFRIVSISEGSKLSLRNGCLVVKQDEVYRVHIKEINTLIIESQLVKLTVPLINKLIQSNVNLIICDRQHNPHVQCLGIRSHSRRSKNIKKQMSWFDLEKQLVWSNIIRQKIKGQAYSIKKYDEPTFKKLMEFREEVEINDRTNREGHAAKVYFNRMFGDDFTRGDDCAINAGLNFGYQVILSCINRHVVIRGYLTEIGLFHRSEYNPFNFSSDLIEPYRVFIDQTVKENITNTFEKEQRDLILKSLNKKVLINGKKQRLINSIPIYIDSVIKAVEESRVNKILFPEGIEIEL